MFNLEQRTAVAAMRAFASPAVYAPMAGDPSTVNVIIDRDVERTVAGMQGVIMEARTELTGYSGELSAGARGDVVTQNGDSWRLIQRAKDDGYLVTWIVTKERV